MIIAIIKYGMGNIASIHKALMKLGYNSIITNSHEEIKNADLIILPGVGSFAKGMNNLKELGLKDLLTKEVIENNKPFIGICLGMQLLATCGTEPNRIEGLGWVDGTVVKLNPTTKVRIPHLGWNNVKIVSPSSELFGEFDNQDFYFIHSYHFKVTDSKYVIMEVTYGQPIVAALHKDNIYAMQFHPEKSQKAGMYLLNKIIKKYAKM